MINNSHKPDGEYKVKKWKVLNAALNSPAATSLVLRNRRHDDNMQRKWVWVNYMEHLTVADYCHATETTDLYMYVNNAGNL